MSNSKRPRVSIKISSDNSLSMITPSKCVFCGMPKETNLIVDAKKLANGKKLNKNITYKIAIPYCKEHEKESRDFKRIRYSTFGAGFLLVLLIGGLLISRSFGILSMILGIPLTLFLAWIAGFVVELTMTDVFGKKYPNIKRFTIVTPPFMSEDVLGLDLLIEGNPRNLSLTLMFDNKTIAYEWAELNHTQVYFSSGT